VVPAGSRWNDLCWLPLLTAAADMTENLSILTLLAIYPDNPPALVYLASSATVLKWSLAAVGLVSLVAALVIRLFKSSDRPPVPGRIVEGGARESAR
jgi:hypothetical protein